MPTWCRNRRARPPSRRSRSSGRPLDDTAFEDWADKVFGLGASLGNEIALKNYRRDIVIEIMNEAGQLAFAWTVFRCWPQHYDAFADLDANSDAILVERPVLAHEGFQRDLSVTEPTEK